MHKGRSKRPIKFAHYHFKDTDSDNGTNSGGPRRAGIRAKLKVGSSAEPRAELRGARLKAGSRAGTKIESLLKHSRRER